MRETSRPAHTGTKTYPVSSDWRNGPILTLV